MEQWEIDLRARLDKEIPNGCYTIGDDIPAVEGQRRVIVRTGKGGKIEYLVALEKQLREEAKMFQGMAISGKYEIDPKYKNMNEEELKAEVEKIFNEKAK